MPTIVPLAPSEIPLVSTESSYIHGGDVGVSIDFDMGADRGPRVEYSGWGTLTISTLALSSTLELMGASSVPPCPSTTVATLGLMIVSHEFFSELGEESESHRHSTTNIEAEVATLYGQIQS